MKTLRLPSAIVLASALFGTAAVAADRALLQASEYMPRAQEESLLDADERKQLAMWRSSSTFLSVSVVTADLSAIETGTLKLVTPDGTLHRYVGTKVDATPQGFPGAFNWRGREATSRDPRAAIDEATFSFNGRAIVGRFRAGGRTYSLGVMVGGKHQMVAEHDPNFRAADDTPKPAPR